MKKQAIMISTEWNRPKRQGVKLRHSKEDKKQYRRRRKSSTVPKISKIPNLRAHGMADMAVKRNPCSTFLTPSPQSASLPSQRGRHSTNHHPKSSVQELNRNCLVLVERRFCLAREHMECRTLCTVLQHKFASCR